MALELNLYPHCQEYILLALQCAKNVPHTCIALKVGSTKTATRFTLLILPTLPMTYFTHITYFTYLPTVFARSDAMATIY